MDALRTAVEKLLANISCDGACQADLYERGFIDEVKAALKSTGPISVSERLPEIASPVLAYGTQCSARRWMPAMLLEYRDGTKQFFEWPTCLEGDEPSPRHLIFDITHWLLLPPKPE